VVNTRQLSDCLEIDKYIEMIPILMRDHLFYVYLRIKGICVNHLDWENEIVDGAGTLKPAS